MKKMRFKAGDSVRIKSLDWYNKNKDKNGNVECGDFNFTKDDARLCGKIVTIEEVWSDEYYTLENDFNGYFWTDEMIECKVEEKTKTQYEDEIELIGYSSPKQFICPIGYEFRDENDNVINAMKIVLEKKKPKYPKTYVKCVVELIRDNPEYVYNEKYQSLETFKELLICRDAYWKIAGEEMGLGESWKPDWNDATIKYALTFSANNIIRTKTLHYNYTLAFPTAEMRNAFYENFKEEIEKYKELL